MFPSFNLTSRRMGRVCEESVNVSGLAYWISKEAEGLLKCKFEEICQC